MYGKVKQITLSENVYNYFARAAKSVNAISTVREFDASNTILDWANAFVDPDHIDEPIPVWSNFLYGADTHIDDVSFDNKFCQPLQAGVCEPLYFLLFTLLPNLRHISLRGGPYHGQNRHLFPSLMPEHRFYGLQRLTVGSQDNTLEWPLSSVGTLFQSHTIGTVECDMTSEWERELYVEP